MEEEPNPNPNPVPLFQITPSMIISEIHKMIDKMFLIMQSSVEIGVDKNPNNVNISDIILLYKEAYHIYDILNNNNNIDEKYQVIVRFLYNILQDFVDMFNVVYYYTPIPDEDIDLQTRMLEFLIYIFTQYDNYMKTQIVDQNYTKVKFIGKNIKDLVEIEYITQDDIEAIYNNERENIVSWFSGEYFYYMKKSTLVENISINDIGLIQLLYEHIHTKMKDPFGIKKFYLYYHSKNYTKEGANTIIKDMLSKFKEEGESDGFEYYVFYIWRTNRNKNRRQRRDFLNIQKNNIDWIGSLLKEIKILFSISFDKNYDIFTNTINKVLETYDELLRYDHLKDYFNIINMSIKNAQILKSIYSNDSTATLYSSKSEYKIPEELLRNVFFYIKMIIYIRKY